MFYFDARVAPSPSTLRCTPSTSWLAWWPSPAGAYNPLFINLVFHRTLVHRYPLHKQIGDVTEANKETPFLQVESEIRRGIVKMCCYRPTATVIRWFLTSGAS